MFFDWRKFHESNADSPAVVDPRRRMTICVAVLVAALLLVFARSVQLEISQGAAFRREATRPTEREIATPAGRGRILARDGTVLARDRTVPALTVEYRRLQEPPDAGWLRAAVRARLSNADRKDAAKRAAARTAVLAERAAMAHRLAALCGLTAEQWTVRAGKIQDRVRRISESVNRRRDTVAARPSAAESTWSARLYRLLFDPPPSPRIIVAEELDYHVMAEDLPPEAVAEIEAPPRALPWRENRPPHAPQLRPRPAGRSCDRTPRPGPRGRDRGPRRRRAAVRAAAPRPGRAVRRTDRPQPPRHCHPLPPRSRSRPRRRLDHRPGPATHGRRPIAKRHKKGANM